METNSAPRSAQEREYVYILCVCTCKYIHTFPGGALMADENREGRAECVFNDASCCYMKIRLTRAFTCPEWDITLSVRFVGKMVRMRRRRTEKGKR